MMLVLFVRPEMMLTTISQMMTTEKKPQRLGWMKATVLIQKLVDRLC
jgi:hypothetical protein